MINSGKDMNIKSYIPIVDLVSIANASSGFLSKYMITIGNYALATKFMLLAVIFDAMDGRVARKLKREDKHDFGKYFSANLLFIVMLIYLLSTSYKFIHQIPEKWFTC